MRTEDLKKSIKEQIVKDAENRRIEIERNEEDLHGLDGLLEVLVVGKVHASACC
jgi:hypothetical protein